MGERWPTVAALSAALAVGGLLAWLAAAGWSARRAGGPLAEAADPSDRGGGHRRIVSLAPSLTETLFAIGAGDRLVAVTDLCDFPAAARELPRVGGLTSSNLHLESVVAARPDLVLSVGLNQEAAVAALRRLGIAVEVIPSDGEGLDATIAAVRRLGVLAGRRVEAARLADRLAGRIAAVEEALAGLPPTDRPRVYFEVWDRPLMTAGPDTFLGELVARAGGENVFADVSGRWVQVSPEAVLARDPQWILAAARPGGPQGADDFASRPGWRDVSAVADGRMHLLDGDLVSRPGPRLVAAFEEVAALLHPERFPAARGAAGKESR
ncbi:MAG TPA: cobalamin-binding protein [Thermoanaerobaculia bacterium]|nr:cobalamin-binding protein [Thermoanaerobaculia bacterium]